MAVQIVYSDKYEVDIGTHVFPTGKYRLIRECLDREISVPGGLKFIEPPLPRDREILLAHTEEYLARLKNGTLSRDEVIKMELPYSKQLVRGAFLSCGGTMTAAYLAVKRRLGVHIGGGFHHAFAGHGEGFCVLNDIAVAVRKLISDGTVARAMVIDCDVHQGNGTADIFRRESRVFTFSIHQENNYPFYKPPGDLDIGLPDTAGDDMYLRSLKGHVPDILDRFLPGLVVYVAGADPYEGDQLGNLGLTMEGLAERDRFVFSCCKDRQTPVAVVLAGGYARNHDDTVRIHVNTIEEALKVFRAAPESQ
ncbi:MAG: histone deacetylase [Candidatus Omnitrophota bacterium]